MRTFVTNSQAKQLLHNKCLVILGDSVQRSVYKDLVLLLQRDQFLTLSQLKSKGEFSFEQDVLVEGGRMGLMTNGTDYREVRQYCTNHHLVRFYFLTRIYSPYMESVLEDFRQGPKPDIIIISSCAWDITRYGLERIQQYKENLHRFFTQIKTIVFPECLLLWALAMPLSKKIKGGFLVPQHRMPDGVHWDAVAHRNISTLVLQHVADAWGVNLHDPPCPAGQAIDQPARYPLRPHLNRRQNFGAVRSQFRSWLPVQPYRPPWQGFPAAGNHPIHYRRGPNPFHHTNLWPGHHVYHHRATCSHMDFRFSAGGRFPFHPHFQADYRCVRRRRPNFRTHPYPPRLPRVTPRYLAYR
ncbi:PC-esterase domain-containing protein 1A-like isoform X2 [Anabas testudineus]|uniref:PC-esterase domain-containing protein 1A-like isoform X2 n=1 Tax=Anabas testudineus TaxID=64144 RepID=UPI000E462293|nr:PC-esterase domain-containing protein 1A-like isoform X2 [Anabas testudineus]